MTAQKLREWRGVKPVAAPAGVAITTRVRTTPDDEQVLDLVGEHLGRLRRTDLVGVCRPVPVDQTLDNAGKRQARRGRLNNRKKALTAQSSARWANAIIAANDEQYRLARDAQHRHIIGLRAAIATIENRLAQPTTDTLTSGQRRARRKAKLLKGWARPEDRARRATNQAAPDNQQASTGSRHRPGTRGTKSRQPNRARTRLRGRATVTPALANNGRLQQ